MRAEPGWLPLPNLQAPRAEWWPGRKVSWNDAGTFIAEIGSGENLALPWPTPDSPEWARPRVFDWPDGEGPGPWRLATPAERAIRQAAWERRRPVRWWPWQHEE